MKEVSSSQEVFIDCDVVPIKVTLVATYSFDSQELAVRYAFFAFLRVF